MTAGHADPASLQKLEETFDPEVRFRPVLPGTGWLIAGLLFTLSMFHFYTAGFGLLRETTHRGIHMAFVAALIFLVFPARASGLTVDEEALSWWSLFAAVKGQAIWTSAAKEYRDGGFKEPILAVSGWYTARRHDEILSTALMRLEGLQ